MTIWEIMREAGIQAQRHQKGEALSDEELTILIRGTRYAIIYLEARGPEFHLAVSPLRRELDQYESFASRRPGCKINLAHFS